MIRLRALRSAVKKAGLADAPVKSALETIADMPEAKKYLLTRRKLRLMLYKIQLGPYAEELLNRAGYRVEMSLADFAYLAKYDKTLLEVVVSIIVYLCSDA
jgi:hypothetical protein